MARGERLAAREHGRRRSPRLSGLLLAAVIIALAAALWLAGGALDWGGNLSIEGFADTIRSWGMWGAAGSIGLMVLHSFVPFPAELLACANGIVYGPVWGTVITWTGAMLGASLAFALSRRFGRPFVERMIAKRHWQVLDNWVAENGWQAILVSRFIPVIAFNLINYAAGLMRLSWWQFLWTTGVGILPLTILMVVAGDNIETLGWEVWLALAISGLALWLLLRSKMVKHKLRPLGIPIENAPRRRGWRPKPR